MLRKAPRVLLRDIMYITQGTPILQDSNTFFATVCGI
jgi:hypothetical protein